jgi:outer membrane protein assembly factor BamB
VSGRNKAIVLKQCCLEEFVMRQLKRTVRALAAGLSLIAVSLLLGANWPQWRGPERNGISNETGLLKEWPAEGPKLLWQREDIGEGYSTPSIVGNRIYVLSNQGLDNEFVQALNVDDGEQVWAQRIGIVGNPDQQPPYPGARSTPTIDGNLLYALGSDGDLVCLELRTGKIVWQKHLRRDFGGKYGDWAYAESPLVDGDVLVCTPGGEDATLVALNKRNGDVIWKSQVPSDEEGGQEAGYASAIVVNAAGVKQYVQFLQKGLVGVDANTGKFLWQYERTGQSPANIPTPVAQGDLVYSSSGRGGGALIRIVPKDGAVGIEEVYFDRKLPTAIGGSILLGDYHYGTSGETTVCAEFKTGKIVWSQPRELAPASLCYADGNFYFHAERDGQVGLVAATPEGYQERGRFTPPNVPDHGNRKAWAYPVVANGRLYIRDWNRLWCYDVSARAREL